MKRVQQVRRARADKVICVECAGQASLATLGDFREYGRRYIIKRRQGRGKGEEKAYDVRASWTELVLGK